MFPQTKCHFFVVNINVKDRNFLIFPPFIFPILCSSQLSSEKRSTHILTDPLFFQIDTYLFFRKKIESGRSTWVTRNPKPVTSGIRIFSLRLSADLFQDWIDTCIK